MLCLSHRSCHALGSPPGAPSPVAPQISACGCGQGERGSAVQSVAGTVQEIIILQGPFLQDAFGTQIFPLFAIPCPSLQRVCELVHALSLSLNKN